MTLSLYIEEDDTECPTCGRVTGFDGSGVVVCDNCGWRAEDDGGTASLTRSAPTSVAATCAWTRMLN